MRFALKLTTDYCASRRGDAALGGDEASAQSSPDCTVSSTDHHSKGRTDWMDHCLPVDSELYPMDVTYRSGSFLSGDLIVLSPLVIINLKDLQIVWPIFSQCKNRQGGFRIVVRG